MLELLLKTEDWADFYDSTPEYIGHFYSVLGGCNMTATFKYVTSIPFEFQEYELGAWTN